MKLMLLSLAVLAALAVVGVFIHHRYTVEPFAAPMVGTAESDADDLRYRLHSRLSTDQKQHLFDGGCRSVTSTDGLPIAIRNAFASITQDKPFALANPRARFNATDVIEPGLPRRRMVYAGACENRWFLEYEKGGIGLSVQVMVLRLEQNSDVHFMWGGSGFRSVASLAALKTAIVSGAFGDADRF
ncbi:MAG: hypothetical protein WBV28_14285 [Terracidiphilus sp.]